MPTAVWIRAKSSSPIPHLWYCSLLYRKTVPNLKSNYRKGCIGTSTFRGKNARLWEFGQGQVLKGLTTIFYIKIKHEVNHNWLLPYNELRSTSTSTELTNSSFSEKSRVPPPPQCRSPLPLLVDIAPHLVLFLCKWENSTKGGALVQYLNSAAAASFFLQFFTIFAVKTKLF